MSYFNIHIKNNTNNITKRINDMNYIIKYICNTCHYEVLAWNVSKLQAPIMLRCPKCEKVVTGLHKQEGMQEYAPNDFEPTEDMLVLVPQTREEYKKKTTSFVNEAWDKEPVVLREFYANKEDAIFHLYHACYNPYIATAVDVKTYHKIKASQ